MYLVDFVYDDVSLSSMGLMPATISSAGSDTNISMGSVLTFTSFKNKNSYKDVLINTSYDENVTASFQIAKNPCSGDKDISFTEEEIRDFMKWLSRRKYFKFFPIYDDDSYENIYFYGNFNNIEAVKENGNVIGFSLTFQATSPFAFKQESNYNVHGVEELFDNPAYLVVGGEVSTGDKVDYVVKKGTIAEYTVTNKFDTTHTKVIDASTSKDDIIGSFIVNDNEADNILFNDITVSAGLEYKSVVYDAYVTPANHLYNFKVDGLTNGSTVEIQYGIYDYSETFTVKEITEDGIYSLPYVVTIEQDNHMEFDFYIRNSFGDKDIAITQIEDVEVADYVTYELRNFESIKYPNPLIITTDVNSDEIGILYPTSVVVKGREYPSEFNDIIFYPEDPARVVMYNTYLYLTTYVLEFDVENVETNPVTLNFGMYNYPEEWDTYTINHDGHYAIPVIANNPLETNYVIRFVGESKTGSVIFIKNIKIIDNKSDQNWLRIFYEDGTSTVITNCAHDETITFDCVNSIISSDRERDDLYDSFNYVFPRLVQDKDKITHNEWRLSYPCDVTVIYESVRKIGVL